MIKNRNDQVIAFMKIFKKDIKGYLNSFRPGIADCWNTGLFTASTGIYGCGILLCGWYSAGGRRWFY